MKVKPHVTLPAKGARARSAPSARRQWEKLNSEKAVAYYDRHVFPWACQEMRRIGGRRGPFEISFVPVGTQPYSPILASLANPAQHMLLLATRATADIARVVLTVLQDEPGRRRIRLIGDGTDDLRIARLVLSEHAAAGYPAPSSVSVDLTGGRKATIAALGAVAATCGFEQSYIEGQPSKRHVGYFTAERFVSMTGVQSVMTVPDRRVARGLLSAGAFAAASELLLRLSERSGAGAIDRCMGEAARGWHRWTQLEWSPARSAFSRAAGLATKPAADWLRALSALALRLSRSEDRRLDNWAIIGLAECSWRLGDRVASDRYASFARIPAAERTLRGLRARLTRARKRCGEVLDGDLHLAASPVAACARLQETLGAAWGRLL